MPQYVKLGPGQPLPPGVDVDAPRYAAVERPAVPPVARTIGAWGAGFASVAALALFGLGKPQPAVLAVTAALVLAIPAWFGCQVDRTMHLSRAGDWVELPERAGDDVPILLLSATEQRVVGAYGRGARLR